MGKFIITEEERKHIKGLYEQSSKLKQVWEKYIKTFYKDGSTELKITATRYGDVTLDIPAVYNTYESNPSAFWIIFDEYFNDLGETPPSKVYIGNNEIKRPQ
jgi:hypothetical protein